jgi:hypothetical protein
MRKFKTPIIIDQTDYCSNVETLEIVRAEYVGGYTLRLEFSDGRIHPVDFAPFILHARNPMTTKYKDTKHFQSFEIEHGNLHWNKYEMCFATDELYRSAVIEYHGFG